MPLSNSVLRRYTPPTCTLEIAAKTSPLSRWVGKSMMKDLRFELRFDDPRQSEDTPVTIRGNAGDLEMLGDAVNSYVQDFLNSSSMELPLTLGTSANGNNSHLVSDVNHFAPNNPQVSEEPRFNNASSVGYPTSDPKMRSQSPRTPTEIYLQPKGLLSHELFLGALATTESGLAVDLSVLQLFDLATALDEYAAEVVALPKLNNPLPWKKTPPAWTSAAAMVLLAVGVTGGITFFNKQNKPQTTASKAGQTSPGLTPTPLLVPVVPVVIPLPTPVVPPALAASPRLTPPPVVSIPTPGTVIVPPLVKPNPGTSINSSPATVAILPRRPTIPSSGSSGIPSLGAPSFSQRNAANPAVGSTAPTQAIIPKAPTAPPALDLPKLLPTPTSGGTVTNQGSPTAAVRGSASADLRQGESTPAPPTANSKLSDVIPQVAEVRSYLQQRWKPPSGLTQTLEYYLILNGDGSIQRIIPLGQAAGKYIDTTSIPLPGEPFVSGNIGGRNPKIRVVFTTDGKVATFLDQAN